MNDSIVTDTLDVRVNATFDLPYDSELELNVTTKSTKQTGPGAIFNLSKKNFQRMGASLNLELKVLTSGRPVRPSMEKVLS